VIRVPGEWRLTLLLLAGCVLLGGLLAVQLQERSAAVDAGGADGAPGPGVETPAPGPPERYAPPALASFDEILARPLFAPDRRPVEVPEPDAAPAGPPPTPLRARLEGVARTGERSVAVVRDLSTNEGLRLSQGMEYKGWTVERVEPERAVLTRGDGEVTELKLERQSQ
jgi:hypothetical protein